MRSETRHISLCAVVVLTLLTSSVTYADNIYVTEFGGGFGNGMILKFDSSGNMSTFASGLSSPTGLAFDSSGNLYVANGLYGGKIEKYSAIGSDLGLFASGLNQPWGLAFDSSGYLYAAEYGNGKIEKYSATGTDLGAFASGLNQPAFIAVVPEPMTLALLGLGGLMLRKRKAS